MELWVIYAVIAAVLISARDIFTKHFIHKYTAIEHLLYYYVLSAIFIILYALYKHNLVKDKIKIIDTKDIWKYVLMASISAIIISPCQILSLKYCDNPGKSKAIVNLNTIIVFIISLFIIKNVKFEMKTFIGIICVVIGIYLIL